MARVLVLLLLALLANGASAHKLSPSLLRLVETETNLYDVTWKTPVAGQKARPVPVLPAICGVAGNASEQIEGTGLVTRWSMRCDGPLSGESLQVEGMGKSTAATLLKIEWLDGSQVQQVINSDNAVYTIPPPSSGWEIAWTYLEQGVIHIWLGLDHLLFVLALIMLVTGYRRLFWTITSFTLGHSVTLSMVVLGIITLPQSLVEFAIAVSIFVLAVELCKPGSDNRWMASHGWVIAFAFGLLHGMGFAGALKELGLPAGDIPIALLTFNVGIEVGQVVFIIGCLLLAHFIVNVLPRKQWQIGQQLAVYAIGSAAAYWCIERSVGGFL